MNTIVDDSTRSPMTREIDLSSEASIVWVKGGPDDYPYLRESSLTVSSRSRPLNNLARSVVAYVTLKPDARHFSLGRFQRRVWTFQVGHDPYPCEPASPNYETACPMQGVKPHSISAGQPSVRGRE